MVDGIKISGINIGNTDLSVTLSREQNQSDGRSNIS